MKTLSRLFILTVLSASTMVACGKKQGDDAAATPACSATSAMQPGQYCSGGRLIQAQACSTMQAPPQGYSCNNGYLIPMNLYSGITGNILSNVQFTNSSMQGAVSLSGTGSFDFNNPRIAYSYGGTVTMSGRMQVTNQSLCGAPIGNYQIQGTGSMMWGAIQSMTLTMTGPATMQLMVSSAVLENPTDGLDRNSMNNRLGILLSNLTVNGQPCGVITTY